MKNRKTKYERDYDNGTMSVWVLTGALLMFLYYYLTNLNAHYP